MYKLLLEEDLKRVILDLGYIKPTDTLLYIPENSDFGDYSSNSPLQLAKQNLGKGEQSSREIANEILEKLGHPHYLERAEVAGPGFLNFYLTDQALTKELSEPLKKKKETGKRIIVEYADPNTHKAFHIGHLRTLVIGEAVSRLLEFEGNEILRVNYGSDVGLTVGKALWGVQQLTDDFEKAKKASLREKAEFLGQAYSFAHNKYEDDPKVKEEIDQLTTKLYVRDPEVLELWELTKEWSLGYFDTIYSRTGSEFDRRVNESEVDQDGKRIVEENIGKVFKEDQGAIIFEGEKHGLHNRVFINSKGNPMYEAKEMGLTELYQQVFPFDKLIILSDKPQDSFHQVVQKAIEILNPSLVGKRHHLSYGSVVLSTGKMSSRLGNIITADAFIDQVVEEIKKTYPNSNNLSEADVEKIAVGAIKFAYLKYSIVSDITLDIKQSISLHGDSGPYLQYTFARITSLLNRANNFEAEKKPSEHKGEKIAQSSEMSSRAKRGDLVNEIAASPTAPRNDVGLEPEEREVLRLLEFFDFYSEKAANEYKPNELCLYLLNLAKAYNLFYEKHSILGSDREGFRLEMSKKVGETIKLGLYLLGIETLERM